MSLIGRILRAVNAGMGGKPARTRRSPSRTAPARPKHTAAATHTRPIARAPQTAKEPPLARIQTLADKGARRSEAEDREFAHLVERMRRNPARLEARLKAAAARRWPRNLERRRRYVYGTLNKLGLLRRNPSTTPVKRAQRLSAAFHGERGEAYRLDAAERRIPPVVVALGEITSIEYRPPGRSQRGRSVWRHESGDRGDGAARSKRMPLLAADPATGRPIIVANGSPMRFSSRRGLVG